MAVFIWIISRMKKVKVLILVSVYFPSILKMTIKIQSLEVLKPILGTKIIHINRLSVREWKPSGVNFPYLKRILTKTLTCSFNLKSIDGITNTNTYCFTYLSFKNSKPFHGINWCIYHLILKQFAFCPISKGNILFLAHLSSPHNLSVVRLSVFP